MVCLRRRPHKAADLDGKTLRCIYRTPMIKSQPVNYQGYAIRSAYADDYKSVVLLIQLIRCAVSQQHNTAQALLVLIKTLMCRSLSTRLWLSALQYQPALLALIEHLNQTRSIIVPLRSTKIKVLTLVERTTKLLQASHICYNLVFTQKNDLLTQITSTSIMCTNL